MREIEIKARLKNLDTIIDALNSQGAQVTSPVTQHDVVYGMPGVDGGSDNAAPWLRIRTEVRKGKETVYFTLKRSITNQLDSIEHETTVGDANELKQIIEQLGFVLYSDLTKRRQKAHIDEIEVCLDYVDGLGSFIEAERLTADDVDYAAVIEGLWVILESLGVSREDEVTDGYDVLLNKHIAKK